MESVSHVYIWMLNCATMVKIRSIRPEGRAPKTIDIAVAQLDS